MLRFFTSVLVFILSSLSALAESDNFDPLTDKEVLRQAIYDNDISFVEAALAKSQEIFLAGDATGEDMRFLYQIFTTTNPKVISFVEGWLKAKPNSPYAHTAQAWIYFTAGWIIRGEKLARETYPEALNEFRILHHDAFLHAQEAYKADKRMIPASDALLRLANSTGTKRQAYKVLFEVMHDDPNIGTLNRGLTMTMPGWGGSWRMAEDMCDFYGPMIKDSEYDPVLYCKLYAGGELHAGERGDWVRATLKNTSIPSLDYLRLYQATSNYATRADAEFAYNYLNREHITWVYYAKRFDRNVAHRYGYDFISEDHQRRARDNALAGIEHDPFDPEWINDLQEGISRYSYTENGSFRISSIENPTREEQIEYARRLLVVAPYDPDHWRDYAQTKYPPNNPDDFLKDEPYLINALVYSNHDPVSLHHYVFTKWQQLDNLERLDTEPQSKEWKKLDALRKAKIEKERQRWLDRRERVNMDRDIRCPMMRAYRLLELICETTKNDQCVPNPMQREMYELVRNDVNKRRACTGEMSVPAHELFYSPIPVDLGEPGG